MTNDIRELPYIEITDTYNRKTGEHLKSVCTTPAGDIIWEEGRKPSKDVVFFPADLKAQWSRVLREI